MYDLIVIGGGAAGFFTAIQLAERDSEARILILEKSNKVLSKVKVSGGGRCNVTHGCFIPSEMIQYYPRGNKELLGPFHRFMCGDMMDWLSNHDIETKIEEDGRVFPVSDSSQSIIDCFMSSCKMAGIEILMHSGLRRMEQREEHWELDSESGQYQGKQVMIATGSTPSVWNMLGEMEYDIVEPVPSLFTFNIKHPLTKELQGLSMPESSVTIIGQKLEESGPLLITHWGLSGPAVLKLSAWAARELHAADYQFEIEVNWLGMNEFKVRSIIDEQRLSNPKRIVKKYPQFNIPRRLWERFCYLAKLYDLNWASLNSVQMNNLINLLIYCRMKVNGKSTFKEEFVTCGGVERKQIDFKSMQSRIHKGLYFAGEVIDIDAVTGGFNFQAAWTEAYIAAEAISLS